MGPTIGGHCHIVLSDLSIQTHQTSLDLRPVLAKMRNENNEIMPQGFYPT